MIWILFALLHGLARALAIDTRRRLRVPALTAITWQTLAAFVLALPFCLRMDWTQPWPFYLAACLTGLLAGLTLLIYDNLHSSRHGRIFNIYMPFEAVFAFLLWLAVAPSSRTSFFADPLQIMSVGLSFVLAVVALSLMRRADCNWQRFGLAVVLGATIAISSVVMKLVLPAGQFDMAALTFVFVHILSILLVLAPAMARNGRLSMPKPAGIHALRIVLSGIGLLGSQVMFIAALIYAPNPGYVIFTAMLLPVWLMGLHKLRHAEENASPVAALLLVISTMTLLLGALLSSSP